MNLRLILASASPRRRQLLQGLDLPVEITSVDVDETPPEGLPNDHVAEYLARKKANAWKGQLAPDQVLVTADTTVVIGDVLLNKPEDAAILAEQIKVKAITPRRRWILNKLNELVKKD